MRKHIFTITYFIALINFSPIFSQEIMPIDELRPGMMAKGLTVFSGDEIEEFGIEIVDIYRNFAPKRNLILVRLHGEKAVFAGPTSGMSGSPVYYNGRLIGALAYSFSSFLKDPLMGVTPINEMLEIFEWEKHRAKELAGRSHIGNHKFTEVALGIDDPQWDVFTEPLKHAGSNGAGFQRLALPLQFGGFSDAAFAIAKDVFNSHNFIPVRGGSAGSAEHIGGELVPGAPIAAVIISGDASIAATGTVTYRDGDYVLGFGHPFFDNGPVTLPIARARILATLSSQMHSQKMSLTGKIVGTLQQDRSTGVLGKIEKAPEMTPIDMSYVDEKGRRSDYHFNMTQEQSIASVTPLYLRLALISGIQSARLATGENSLRVEGTLYLHTGETISLDNLYPGYQPLPTFSFLNSILHSTGDIASTMGSVATNKFHNAEFDSMRLHFTSVSGRLSAGLEKVWFDRPDVEPGEKVTLFYQLRPYLDETVQKSYSFTLPPNIPAAKLTFIIGGARDVAKTEKRYFPSKYNPVNYKQLIELLQNERKNDALYIQIAVIDNGVFAGSSAMPAFPPSLSPVIGANNSKGEILGSRYRIIQEFKVPQEWMIEGLEQVTLRKE